jgi:thioredoxin 1
MSQTLIARLFFSRWNGLSVRLKGRKFEIQQAGSLLYIFFEEKIMSEHIKEVTDDNFEKEVLQSDKPVVVDFWAEWCGPCKMLAPTVEAVAREFDGKVKFVKLDIEASTQTPVRYNVRGIPTLLLFNGGAEVDRAVGNQPRNKIVEMLDRALGAAKAS